MRQMKFTTTFAIPLDGDSPADVLKAETQIVQCLRQIALNIDGPAIIEGFVRDADKATIGKYAITRAEDDESDAR